MASSSGTVEGNGASDTTGAMSDGDAATQKEIQQMNDAFALATKVNMEITVAKTVDGAEETAAQQRPNIG